MRHVVAAAAGAGLFAAGFIFGAVASAPTASKRVPHEDVAREDRSPGGSTDQSGHRPEEAHDVDSKHRREPTDLALAPAYHDFGRMLEGEERTATFRIERPASASIRLGRIYSPCPCVRVSVDKPVFAAGEPASVRVALHSLTLEGRKTFPAYVELLEPTTAILRCDVSADIERVPAKMFVRPDTIHLGTVHGPKAVSVALFNLTNAPVRIECLRCSVEGLEVSVPEGLFMRPGAVHTVRVEVPKADMAAGPIRGEVIIETSCPQHAVIKVPVDGTAAR